MQSLAHESEWDNVKELETGRQAMIKNFFATTPSTEEAEMVANGIHKIMEIDKEIMDLGKKRLGVLSDQIHDLKAGQNAQDQYRKFA
jgi:hypothetical protein